MVKKITSCDLAKICGVSQGTVDRALNNRSGIAKKTKEKIIDAAAKYGYYPNIYASKLAGGKSTFIGVVVFDLKNDYFAELVHSIDNCCRNLGFTSITMFSGKDKEDELQCIQKLISIGVDGLIICPINKGETLDFIKSLEIPTVVVGNPADGFPYCGIDNFQAMKELTNCAVDKGAELIYYSPGLKNEDDVNYSAQKLRYEGFCEGVQTENISFYVCTDMEELDLALENCKTSSPKIICSTDYYALKVFSKYSSIPLYTFDGTRILSMINRQIVSVGVDADEVAKRALDIISHGKNDDHIIPYKIKSNK